MFVPLMEFESGGYEFTYKKRKNKMINQINIYIK